MNADIITNLNFNNLLDYFYQKNLNLLFVVKIMSSIFHGVINVKNRQIS